MYFLKYIFLFILAFMTAPCFCQSELSSVKATLEKFKTAFETENYSDAINYTDSATIVFYDSILHVVNNVDSATLTSSSLITKLMVLNFRHRDTSLIIKKFNGKELLKFAMEKEMISYTSIMGDSIHYIQIHNGLAKIITSFKSTSSTDTLVLQLIKENEKWKVSLISGLSYTEALILGLMRESGKTENEFLFSLLENITGTRPSNEIWHRK